MDLDDACRQQRTTDVLALLARTIPYTWLTPTLLEFAATSPDIRVLQAVLNNGGKPNCEIHKGKTLLFFAMKQRHKAKVDLLLDARADISHPINGRGMLPLHYASLAPLGLAAVCLERNADVNATYGFKNGATPLMLAAAAKQADVARLLVKHNADVHATDNANCTALHYACKAGNYDIARWLVQDLGVNARHVVFSGDTALHHATGACSAPLVEFLIHHGCSVHDRDGGGKTPLALAAVHDKRRRAPILQVLMQYCAHVDAATVEGMTPLHFACRAGHFHAAKLLVDAGADLDARGPEGYTALFYAARIPDLRMARMLMDSGCDMRVRVGMASVLGDVLNYPRANFAALFGEYLRRGVVDLEDDLLHKACRARNRGAIAALLRKGVNVNVADNLGSTALVHAVGSKDVGSVRMLLRAGADPQGALLLCFKTRMFAESEACAEMIVQHGGDVNENALQSLSLLCWAVEYSHAKAVNFLLEHGADVGRTVTWYGVGQNTALHVAAWHGKCQHVVVRLLEAGADVHAVNADGLTPLFSAVMNEAPLWCMEMLLKHGARVNGMWTRTRNGHETPMHVAARRAKRATMEYSRDSLTLLLEAGGEVDAVDAYGLTPLFRAVVNRAPLSCLQVRGHAMIRNVLRQE